MYKPLVEGRHQVVCTSSIGGHGQRQVKYLLDEILIREEASFTQGDLDSLFEKVGWEWNSRYGNWPKRWAKSIRQAFGIKMSGDDLARFGTRAREDCFEDTTKDIYIVPVRGREEWEEGTYGDKGSCFFGCRVLAWDALRLSAGYSIRIHDENDQPEARCFGFNLQEGIVLFNAYCVGDTFGLLQITRWVMEVTRNLSYKKVEGVNHGIKDGILWINGGRTDREEKPQNVYIIGDLLVQWVKEVDLDAPVFCQDCDKPLFYYGTTLFENEGATCEECYNKKRSCSRCGYRDLPENMVQIGREPSEAWRCNDCLDEDVVQVDCCPGHYEFTSHIYYLRDGSTICPRCYHDHNYIRCECCGNHKKEQEDRILTWMGHTLCRECLDAGNRFCFVCGAVTRNLMLDGVEYCSWCYQYVLRERRRILFRQFSPITHLERVAS